MKSLFQILADIAPSDLQLPLRQCGAGNVYLLVVLLKAKSRGTSILGEVRNVEISRALLSSFYVVNLMIF